MALSRSMSGASSPLRGRSKTGTASGGLIARLSSRQRGNSSTQLLQLATSAEAPLEYAVAVCGTNVETTASLLALLSDATLPLLTPLSLTRDLSRGAARVRVSFQPLLGVGVGLADLLFDDAALRRADGVLFAARGGGDGDEEGAAFRRLRKRASAVRSDLRVMLVVRAGEEGGPESEQLRGLATSNAAGFRCVATRADAEGAVATLLEDVVGGGGGGGGSGGGVDGGPGASGSGRTVEVAVVGDVFVGKTTLVQRLARGERTLVYAHTTAVVSYPTPSSLVGLRLIDTPSLSFVSDVPTALPREVAPRIGGAVLVFSVRNRASFTNLGLLADWVAQACGRQPTMVIGTNADEVLFRAVSRAEAEALCRSRDLGAYVEVNSLDEGANLTADTVLAPLLQRILGWGQHGASEADVAATVSHGVLYLRVGEDAVKHLAEIKRDLLVLQPSLDPPPEEATASASPPAVAAAAAAAVAAGKESSGELRFSGVFATLRRRNSQRASLQLRERGNSGSSAPPSADSSPKMSSNSAAQSLRSSQSGGEVRTILLAEATVTAVAGRPNRPGFVVEDCAGRVHELEVADTAARRDEWVAALRAAGLRSGRSETGAPSALLSAVGDSQTLGRRRGKTLSILTK